MKRNSDIVCDQFETDRNNNITLTKQATVNSVFIERIIGKRKVKGRKTDFEEIELAEFSPFDAHVTRTRCLVKRKDLSPSILMQFILFYCNGARSVQWHPYTDDLLDKELLDDLGVEVLTYKHYYLGDKQLCDVYCPVMKDDVTEELKNELKERTKNAIRQENFWYDQRQREKPKNQIQWESL